MPSTKRQFSEGPYEGYFFPVLKPTTSHLNLILARFHQWMSVFYFSDEELILQNIPSTQQSRKQILNLHLHIQQTQPVTILGLIHLEFTTDI